MADWTGMLAALILPGTVMFTLASRAATPDAPLIFFFTLTLLIFVEAKAANWNADESSSDSGSRKANWALGFVPAVLLYVAVALAVLTKGLAGFLPPLAVIGLFLMIIRKRDNFDSVTTHRPWRRNAIDWLRVFTPYNFLRSLILMRPLLGLVVILLVAGPWFVAVGKATDGEFLRLFFFHEHLGRATEVFEGHSGGLWFYPVALLLGFFPWSILAVPVIGDAVTRKSGQGSRGTTLLICWVVVVVGMFSLASTKLPSYVTPCYPALALLTSSAIYSFGMGIARMGDRWYRLGFWVLGLIAISATIGLAIAGNQLLGGRWLVGVVGLPLIGGTLFLIWCWNGLESRRKKIPFGLAIMAGLFSLVMFGPAAVLVESSRQTDAVLSVIRSAGPDVPIGSFQCLESSWVVYGQHPIYELTRSKTNDNELDQPRKFWEKLPWASPRELVDRHPGALILTTDRYLNELKDTLGQPVTVIADVEYFMRDWRLILVTVNPESAERYAQRKNSDSGPFMR